MADQTLTGAAGIRQGRFGETTDPAQDARAKVFEKGNDMSMFADKPESNPVTRHELLRTNCCGDEIWPLNGFEYWTENLSYPEEFKNDLWIKIEDVDGYEGEHHVEISIGYDAPETADEAR